jgi:hypothetical protein
MSAFPASQQATEGYGSLEEYIFDTDRNHDREIRSTARLWEWQEAQVQLIKSNIGTNKTEVRLRAFSMGLKSLREGTSEDLDKVGELYIISIRNIQNMYGDCRGVGEFENSINSTEFDLSCSDRWEKTDPISLTLRDSEHSEVRDSYVTDMLFGAWIWRVLIALGLRESKYSTGKTQSLCNEILTEVDQIAYKAKELIEKSMREFVSANYPDWKEDGISKKNYQRVQEMLDYMETDNREMVELVLNDLEGDVNEG